MASHARGVRRLCLLVDIEGYSKLAGPEQLRVQARLRRMLDTLLRKAGVRASSCERQQKGDGELVVLPSGVDESRVVPGLITGLRDLLSADHGAHPGGHRLRMRAALDQSVVHLSAEGFVGTAVVSTERLVNSDALRGALAAHPGDLAVAVTGPLYEDVLRHGWGGVAPTDFHRTTISNPAKGFSAEVYTWPVPVPPAGRFGAGTGLAIGALGAGLAAGALAGAAGAAYYTDDLPEEANWSHAAFDHHSADPFADAPDHPEYDDGHPADGRGTAGHDDFFSPS